MTNTTREKGACNRVAVERGWGVVVSSESVIKEPFKKRQQQRESDRHGEGVAFPAEGQGVVALCVSVYFVFVLSLSICSVRSPFFSFHRLKRFTRKLLLEKKNYDEFRLFIQFFFIKN